MTSAFGVASLIGGALVSWFTGFSVWRSFFWVGIIGAGILVAVTLAQWWVAKRARGDLLLDCGPHPSRKLFLFNAVLFASIAGSRAYIALDEVLWLLAVPLGLVASALYVWIALGRLQIRQGGIWQYFGLLEWNRIEDFHWEGDFEANPCLVVDYRSKMPFAGRAVIPVAGSQKEAVEVFMRRHVPEA